MDSKYVTIEKKVDAKHICLPMYETVMEKIKKPIVFNICMLGALIGLTDLIPEEAIVKMLERRLPEKVLDMNRSALKLGMGLVEVSE